MNLVCLFMFSEATKSPNFMKLWLYAEFWVNLKTWQSPIFEIYPTTLGDDITNSTLQKLTFGTTMSKTVKN